MADNVDITVGDGTGVVAADEIQVDGTHTQGVAQFVKLVDGTLNGTGSIRVNQAAKANALTVAPASDISDATYIGDIKFGEALPAGTNEIGKLAAGTAGIGKLTANSGVDIGDVDVTSIIPGTAATNLGKARDSALGATDTGVMSLVVRDDSLTTLTPADGDFVPLRVNSTGALHVTGGGGGTEYTEDVATANPIVGSATLVERDDALGGLTPAEGDWATLYCDANGALWTHDNALDAALDGNYLNCNMNLAGSDAQAGEGAITATTQRVTLATDDDGVAHLATIAGDTTSIDGKVTACNTGAVVLSSGTVTTVSTVTNLAQMGGAALAMNEGVLGVGVQRVTLATDDDGVAHLATIAGDTTSIDGKITACNTGAVVLSSGTVTTVSTVTNLAQMGGTAITMDEGVHDAGTQRVTIATDDDGVAHLATIANRNNGVNAITDWTAVAQNVVGESGTLDCSTHDGTSILIQAFLDTTTAHTGTRFIVQVSSNTTGNEDWHDYRESVYLIGTAATDLIEDNPLAQGATSLTLTGHALTVEAIWIGIEDSSLINSELIFVASQTANAVVALDGTTNQHAQNTAVWNVAISKVIILDATVNRVRVIVDNTYDDNGSTLNYKVRATDLER